MAKENKNFYKTTDGTTDTYHIQFDYGTQTIDINNGKKVVFDFVHGGFENIFTRKGNDLIIGDDMYFAYPELMGVGYGKEEWTITQDGDGNFSAEIKKYHWMGSTRGYSETPASVEVRVMTQEELTQFAEQYNLTLNEGENTLYTRWPVVPNPNVTYHMEDCGHYAPANGKLILKNYFKYENNDIYVGNQLLSGIIQNSANSDTVKRLVVNKQHVIYDTFLSENISGKDYAETIYSNQGDDTITGGKGNDRICLGGGNKTIIVGEGDGGDTVIKKAEGNTTTISFDTDDISYTKSGNNLVINRHYGYKTEQTVVSDFFKNLDNYNQLIITNDDDIISNNLVQELLSGDKRLSYDMTSNKIKGSDLSDEFYSTYEDETFSTGKGNDIIRFDLSHTMNDRVKLFNDSFGDDMVNITPDSNITLDFNTGDREDINFTYEKRDNDVVITATREVRFTRVRIWNRIYNIQEKTDGGYNVTISNCGTGAEICQENSEVTQEVWTEENLTAFRQQNGLNSAQNVPIHYIEDPIIWEPIIWDPIIIGPIEQEIVFNMPIGSVTLKDYFKYNNSNIFVGDTSLMDILKNLPEIAVINESYSDRGKKIIDTFMNDEITGSRFSDTITSSCGDDNITGGKGNDVFNLGEGNKTVNINKGDGIDTINISQNNTSTEIVLDDVMGISLKKYSNNLIIYRKYDGKLERTVIRNFFRNNLENNIIITSDNNIIWDSSTDVANRFVYQKEPDCFIFQYDSNELNQNVCAWQSTCEGSAITDFGDMSEYEDLPVLIAQN